MITRSLLCAAVAGLAVLVGPAPAAARPPLRTVATGLDSPRGLAFGPHGELYVAESGRGGVGPCPAELEGGLACLGRTGAITRIAYGSQQRILSHLPSVAAPGGAGAAGPSDVSVDSGGHVYFTVGLGGGPRRRGPLIAGATGLYRAGPDTAVPAGLGAAGAGSNPNAVLVTGRDRLVVDAGRNALLRVGPRGRILTVATFPRRTVAAPAGLPGGPPAGTPILMAPTPTSVVRGPDGALYVGELTGFPFRPGQARIWRVEPGRPPQVYATGFTGVVDLAWAPDGHLYVLEAGTLLRVARRGPHQVVSAGLTAPGGLAVRGRHAYVTDCGVCRGTGSVVRIDLG
ncbi:ScyD/ScyE family protein [Actinoplanes aureus]|uniref:ScyD/ScyE family protein n=1 Tax=Actinoplanes aureus TaxID=2792083 RepID=A0A931C8A8_9ACTN|nr:ScyD/ScyE family protein [Actinoplanes aureus]MBG0562328.1 ScyD/ScyE family protein [Actinoplanes aureus]